MSKFINVAKYAKLVQNETDYARRMRHLSNRIFGEVTRPTTSQSMKVIQLFSETPLYLRKEVINHYPRHPEMGRLMWNLRSYGLYRDEHADWREEMKRLRALRGKAPPERKTKEEGRRWKAKQKKLEEEAKARAAAGLD